MKRQLRLEIGPRNPDGKGICVFDQDFWDAIVQAKELELSRRFPSCKSLLRETVPIGRRRHVRVCRLVADILAAHWVCPSSCCYGQSHRRSSCADSYPRSSFYSTSPADDNLTMVVAALGL